MNLEAHLRAGAHHPHLSTLDRVDVERLAVVGVDHRDDVGLPVRVAADPADDLRVQEVVDLGPVELGDHAGTLAARKASFGTCRIPQAVGEIAVARSGETRMRRRAPGRHAGS